MMETQTLKQPNALKNFKTMTGLGTSIIKANLMKKRTPIFLSFFITNRCNLRCKYCFVSDENISREYLRKEYSKEEAIRIIDEFYDMGTRMIYMLGGEPLVHRDIGGIVNYIVDKGIYLHIVTNGIFIERDLDKIINTHVLCVSVDGIEESNDELRGEGTFKKIVHGIRVAVKAGIPTRVHAVLTRKNLKNIRPLAELCQNLEVDLTISPPNYLGKTDQDYLRISKEEYKEFWNDYAQMQSERLPIGNSPKSIKKCLDWPKDYHTFIREKERFPGYKPVFCMNGHTYVALGADGTMYNCINLGCTNGPNIYDMSIREAWNRLLEWRPDCVSCASINCIETAELLRLRLGALSSGWRFHARKRN